MSLLPCTLEIHNRNTRSGLVYIPMCSISHICFASFILSCLIVTSRISLALQLQYTAVLALYSAPSPACSADVFIPSRVSVSILIVGPFSALWFGFPFLNCYTHTILGKCSAHDFYEPHFAYTTSAIGLLIASLILQSLPSLNHSCIFPSRSHISILSYYLAL